MASMSTALVADLGINPSAVAVVATPTVIAPPKPPPLLPPPLHPPPPLSPPRPPPSPAFPSPLAPAGSGGGGGVVFIAALAIGLVGIALLFRRCASACPHQSSCTQAIYAQCVLTPVQFRAAQVRSPPQGGHPDRGVYILKAHAEAHRSEGVNSVVSGIVLNLTSSSGGLHLQSPFVAPGQA